MITISEADFTYEGADAPAVRGLSLRVEAGEMLAVIGHNGSGKSTLARMMNALIVPSGGYVEVCGLRTDSEENQLPIRQQCAMVFQNPDNQIVATIVEEDIAFGPENLGLPPEEIRRRVDDALAFVHMEDFFDAAPHLLSGGQKQRIAIAGAIAMQPRVLVLDESTAMLDPKGRAEVLDTVRRLNREQGITVVLITHFMDEAALCDRIAVMHQGALALLGTPAEVFRRREQLQALDLDVPMATALALELRSRGIALPGDILSADEVVNALCP